MRRDVYFQSTFLVSLHSPNEKGPTLLNPFKHFESTHLLEEEEKNVFFIFMNIEHRLEFTS
jgi:hypothetical protein